MSSGVTHSVETVRALLDAGNHAEALDACAQLLRAHPAGAEACLVEGLLLTLQGKPREAITAYDRAISLAPDTLPAYLGIAEILAEKGWLHSALVVMESARAATSLTGPANSLIDRLQSLLATAGPLRGTST